MAWPAARHRQPKTRRGPVQAAAVGAAPPPKPPPPPKRPPKPPALPKVHAPVASVGWMVSVVACTTPPEFLGPTARTQLSTVRSAAVPAEDSVTDSVVGTVTELVVPVLACTVSTSPDTAVTRPVTKAAFGFRVGAPVTGIFQQTQEGYIDALALTDK